MDKWPEKEDQNIAHHISDLDSIKCLLVFDRKYEQLY